MATRSVAIANRHPRLRLDRRTVARVIHTLDAHAHRFVAAPTRPAAARRAKSRIENPKSKIPPGELSLVFLTDAALAKLHATFLADPTVTDVITFEGDPALGTAGEICVSVDAALRHLSEFVAPASAGTRRPHRRYFPPLSSSARHSSAGAKAAPLPALSSIDSFSTELTLYLVHGWLHLAGYDDLVPAKKRAMRRAESRALALLRRLGALPRFTFSPTSPP
jgi:probable rRNA maturation factor